MQSALLTLILSFLIMMAVGPACIPLLQRWKFGQTERTDTHIIFTGTKNCDLFMSLSDEIIRHTEALLHIIYGDKRIIILIFFSQKTYRT